MPPRAARGPKKDSVTAAVKKHLTKRTTTTATPAPASNGKSAAPAAASRVSRRRGDVVPQKAPEWQKMALKTAAASAKLTKRTATAKRQPAPAAKATGKRAAAASKAASGTRGAPPKKRAKGKRGGSEDDESEAAAAADDSDASVSTEESSSDEDAGRGRGKGRTAKATRSNGAAPAAAAASGGKRGSRVLVADLMCSRCRLRMDQWPFCGITGEAHVVPVPAAAGGKADAKEAAASH